MKASIQSIDGKKKKKMDLPEVFNTQYKPTLIKRAVVAIESRRYQPHGVSPRAGLNTSAEYVGRRRKYRASIGTGSSHLPRIKPGGGGRGQVRIVPQAKGGRRAHPPKVEKKIEKKLNKKEKKAAMCSCIAATANKEVVEKRGYSLEGIELPIIVEDKIQELKKTKESLQTLQNLGLTKNLEKKKRIVIVGGGKACRNLPGIQVIDVEEMNPETLAPGTHPGVLTVWTESAIRRVGEKYDS